jgi:polyhydroxyalkanoate synthase
VGNRALEMLHAVLGTPEAPVGTTPKQVVWRKNKARLYRYARGAPPTRRTPVFLVMPLINRAYILDLRPGASLVEFLLQQGFEVFMLDWGIPGEEDRGLSLDVMLTGYLARAAHTASKLAGGVALTLLGYSTGGTLAACFAALYPEGPIKIKNLVLFTTPIDFSEAGQLGRWSRIDVFPVDKLTEVFPTVPTNFMAHAMRMISPLPGTIGPYVRLWDRLADPHFDVSGWQAMSRWVNDAVPFASTAYRQWITEFYQHNKLARGTLVLAGQRVRLERIRCPLLNVAGSADTITPRSTTDTILQLVGSEDKEELVLQGGHVGILVGRSASTELWPRVARWLEQRD